MRKLNQLLSISILILLSTILLTALPTDFKNNKSEIMTKTSENSCSLHVKTKHGSAAKSIKVTTDVSGGISCIGGRSFQTDSYGEVRLKWVSGCYLKKLFVDGRAYEVDYQDGETYYLTMK